MGQCKGGPQAEEVGGGLGGAKAFTVFAWGGTGEVGHSGPGWVGLNEFGGLWDSGSVCGSLASGPKVRRARRSCPQSVGLISQAAGGVRSGLGVGVVCRCTPSSPASRGIGRLWEGLRLTLKQPGMTQKQTAVACSNEM